MKYKEYKSKIYNEETFKEQINLARVETKVQLGLYDPSDRYVGIWVPFNLEREFIDFLIEGKRYIEAKEILERMKKSYHNVECQNFLESYEYRLNSIIHSNKNIENEIILAKKEFNNHTILIISIIVGVITIFGTANQTLSSTNEGNDLHNFFAIVASIIFLTYVAFWANNKFKG